MSVWSPTRTNELMDRSDAGRAASRGRSKPPPQGRRPLRPGSGKAWRPCGRVTIVGRADANLIGATGRAITRPPLGGPSRAVPGHIAEPGATGGRTPISGEHPFRPDPWQSQTVL